jgi:hypothetical protein
MISKRELIDYVEKEKRWCEDELKRHELPGMMSFWERKQQMLNEILKRLKK